MDKKTIVLTLYGSGKAINYFTVSLFDNSGHFNNAIAQNYCSNINELELKDENWIYASIVDENKKIKFEKPRQISIDILDAFDARSIQRVIREVDTQELGKALKAVKKEIFGIVLRNMSKRAAMMLIEDMEYMGPVRLEDAQGAQMKILSIIRHLEDIGEIIVPKSNRDEIIV
jgi:flagellar motor switch protein FliG